MSDQWRLARGSVRVLPLLFFLLGFVFAAVGPGAVAGVALVKGEQTAVV